ncbi:MAG: hypothetical protein KDB10_02685, partial [Acidimicrobiales bacterium]|nr:hypothetical protein [Acidimicrobiales bacterium]
MTPLTATRPISPEPGATSLPASSITRALAPNMNLAVPDVPPALDTDWPMPRASEDENASMRNIPSLWVS